MKPPARRDQYIPQVIGFMPTCHGEELSLRCSILLVRDMATANARQCSSEAFGVLSHVQHLALTYAFTPMPIDALRTLRQQMIRLVSCASGLETFAYALAVPHDQGGADASGG